MFYGDEEVERENILSVHSPDGLVIRNMKLLHVGRLSNVAMKSNGNFVYAQLPVINADRSGRPTCIIREVDEDGREIRCFDRLGIHMWHINGRLKQLFLDAS